MKLQNSSKAISRIIKENLRKFWVIPLIGGIIMFLAGPMNMIIMKAGDSDIIEESLEFNFGFSFAIILISLCSGIAVLICINRKSSSDLIYALPVTRGGMFLASYISGVVMIAIPIVINGLLMWFLSQGATAASHMKWIGLSFLCCLALYAVTYFAGVISGNIFMHVFNACFLNVIAVLLIKTADCMMQTWVFGYQKASAYNTIIEDANPLTALSSNAGMREVVLYIIVVTAVTLLALLFYKNRHAECTGESLVFSGMRYAFLGLITFMGMIILGMLTSGIGLESRAFYSGSSVEIAWLLTGMIVGFIITFITMHLIIFKSPNFINKNSLITGLITVMTAVVIIVPMKTDIIGISSKKAAVASTKAVAVDVINLSGDTAGEANAGNNIAPGAFRGVGFEKTTVNGEESYFPWLKSKENIEAGCKIQNALADMDKSKIMTTADSGYYSEYSISVTGIDGKKMKRYYPGIAKDVFNLITKQNAKIYESKEYKDKFKLSNLKYKINDISYFGNASEYHSIPAARRESLIKALDKDFKARRYKDIRKKNETDHEFTIEIPYDPDMFDQTALSEGSNYNIIVYKTDMNTLAWIKKNIK